jgi:FMN-dependent oxidoreductase (nitrilotriacetate monooxygenase family)
VRYRIAAEYLEVVQGLWDSWEDDAHVGDQASGVFLDPEKLHRLDHKGAYFQVRGPLNIKRSRQGQPVIFQAGASDDGRNFAARNADAIFGSAQTLEEAQEYYRDVKARARGFGRDTSKVYIMPGIGPIIGLTEAEAEQNYQTLAALASLETGLGFLARTFNDHDFSQYDLDAPFPDVAALGWNSQQSSSLKILAQVRAENLTLRQIAQRLSTPRGQFIGTPAQIADRLETWFANEAADGYVVFETMPGQLALFVDHVVPLLQARGLFRTDYEGETFRENLGLPFPVNRYTAARQARSAA